MGREGVLVKVESEDYILKKNELKKKRIWGWGWKI